MQNAVLNDHEDLLPSRNVFSGDILMVGLRNLARAVRDP